MEFPDSYIIHNFLKPEDCINIIEKIKSEVHWGDFTINNKVLSRKGCFQGDDNHPWLRCPSIENQIVLPWTFQVKKISDIIASIFGHEMNIAKIQEYIDENTSISAHSDKIIDLDDYVPIYNIRFGATRRFRLKNKFTKEITDVLMPHNSLFVLGPITNRGWTHEIPKENFKVGPSYSIIYRKSVTFKDIETGSLYGERTIYKTRESITLPYIESNATPELIKAFRLENKTIM